MALRETYIRNLASVCGYKVLITRYRPPGMKAYWDEWCPALSPSKELLWAFKDKKISRKEYIGRFKREIWSRPDAIEKLKELFAKSKTVDVYLVCYEKDAAHCHRSILLEMAHALELLETWRPIA